MKIKQIVALTAGVILLCASMLAGCSSQPAAPANEPAPQSTPASEEKGTVHLVYVQWACAEAETHIAEAVLNDMGYDVEKDVVDAGVMWAAVAGGDADAFTTAWLPYTHESYWDEYKDQVEDVSTIYEGAKLGLVVPSYVTIDSIAEMKDHKDEFGGQIVGIDPGAGIMKHTAEDTMPAYGLDDWKLVESSGAAMAAELGSAIDKDEWVAVTGWAPHWKFFKYDLKFLEDPEATYGGSEEIHVIARQGFSQDMPEVADMFSNMYLTDAQLGEVMYNINVEDVAPEDAARNWVDANENIIMSWVTQ